VVIIFHRIMRRALSRLSAVLAAAELPIVALVAPGLLFPTPRRVIVALLVPLVWLCNRCAGRHLVPHSAEPVLFFLLGMVGVSLAVTFDIAFSLGKV
jgi:hypothetical protein